MGKGLQRKLLKTTCLAFAAQADAGFGGAHAPGVPKTEIVVPVWRWKCIFSHRLGETRKAAVFWATLIPVKAQGKIFGFVGVFT